MIIFCWLFLSFKIIVPTLEYTKLELIKNHERKQIAQKNGTKTL